MTAPTFVRLKSGGPIMSVVHRSGDEVLCQWFVGDESCEQQFHRGVLHAVTLEDIPPVSAPVRKLREVKNDEG